MKPAYQENSITLLGGVAMGTGVMIGAGIVTAFSGTCRCNAHGGK